MKIVLLICDEFPGILTPDIPSYEWMFEKMFRACEYNSKFEVYHAFNGELPNNLNQSDLYLISGSTDDSFGDKAWIVSLREWIRKAIATVVR